MTLTIENDLLHPDAIDHALRWSVGTAERLARRGVLPYHCLPGGEIRMRWEEVRSLIRFVPPEPQEPKPGRSSPSPPRRPAAPTAAPSAS